MCAPSCCLSKLSDCQHVKITVCVFFCRPLMCPPTHTHTHTHTQPHTHTHTHTLTLICPSPLSISPLRASGLFERQLKAEDGFSKRHKMKRINRDERRENVCVLKLHSAGLQHEPRDSLCLILDVISVCVRVVPLTSHRRVMKQKHLFLQIQTDLRKVLKQSQLNADVYVSKRVRRREEKLFLYLVL